MNYHKLQVISPSSLPLQEDGELLASNCIIQADKTHEEIFALFTAAPKLLEAAQLLLELAHSNWKSLECGDMTIPLRARLGNLHEICESIKAVDHE